MKPPSERHFLVAITSTAIAGAAALCGAAWFEGKSKNIAYGIAIGSGPIAYISGASFLAKYWIFYG
jgi:hypothetical protein